MNRFVALAHTLAHFYDLCILLLFDVELDDICGRNLLLTACLRLLLEDLGPVLVARHDLIEALLLNREVKRLLGSKPIIYRPLQAYSVAPILRVNHRSIISMTMLPRFHGFLHPLSAHFHWSFFDRDFFRLRFLALFALRDHFLIIPEPLVSL